MEMLPPEELNQIKFIRMNNGEDIISKVSKMVKIENGKTHYYLDKPLKIIYTVRQSSQQSDALVITLVQWIFDYVSETQSFSVLEDNIMTLSNPSAEMLKYYTEAIEKYNNRKDTKRNKMVSSNVEPDNSFDSLTDEELDALESILNEMLPDKSKLH